MHLAFLDSNLGQLLFSLKPNVLVDLLLDRVTARPSGLQTIESSETEAQTVEVEVVPGPTEQAECLSNMETITCSRGGDALPSDTDCSPELKVSGCDYDECLTGTKSSAKREHSKDMDLIDVANETSCSAVDSSYMPSSQSIKDLGDVDMSRSNPCSSVLEEISGCTQEQDNTDMAKSGPSPGLLNGFSSLNDSSVSMDYQNSKEDSEHVDVVKCNSITAQGNATYGNGYASANKYAIPVGDGGTVFSGVDSFSTETSSAEMHQLKRRLPFHSSETDHGNGVKKVEISGDKLII